MLASTVSGFAAAGASSSRPDDDGPAVARSLPSPPQHVAAPSTDRVIDRLDRRRRAARQRLHAAHSRSDQARAAAALADAYRTAREELSPAVGPRKSLGEQLRVVEQAYERLRDAARSGRPGAWGAARETARDAETDLELMLRSQPWT